METAKVRCVVRLRINSDGNGVRSVVFLYGCPLSCIWCCNPETRLGEKYKNVTTEELYDLVKRDSIYFSETNGGVTFSGGEPLLYADFIKEFCEKYGQRFNVNIETSLFSDFDRIQVLVPFINDWYIDWKQADSELHEKYTGYGNEQILNNLKKLSMLVKPRQITITYPVIPGYTNQEDNVFAMIRFMRENGISQIELHPYRKRREEKYKKYGLSYVVIEPIRRDDLIAIEQQLSSAGIVIVRRAAAIERRKCDVLKDIRKKIALRNNLSVDFRDCTFRGRCAGTCPKCEEELTQINEQLSSE